MRYEPTDIGDIMRFISWLIVLGSVLLSCSAEKRLRPPKLGAEFNRYWQQGKAELSRYALTQARYGNLNKGEMIVITVTEPFNGEKQVKSDAGQGVGVRQVLKAQTMRRFTTGIYDYAMTTTSFKPIDDAVANTALKIIGTSIDWCGQTFTQLNQTTSGYRVESRSYFETEADETFSVGQGFSEDEIWQRIRLAPEELSVGSINVLPSLVTSRLRHRRLAAENATATLGDYAGKDFSGEQLRYYRLTYEPGTSAERVVEFIFESTFPHKIVGYTDEYADGFVKPRRLKSIARLTKQAMVDYWAKHDPEFETLRKPLGVSGFSQ